MYARLRRDATRVDAFYDKQHIAIERRIVSLFSCLDITLEDLPQFDEVDLERVDLDEVADLHEALLEFQNAIREVEWYRKLNEDGFHAIRRKLEKFHSSQSDAIKPKAICPEFVRRPQALHYLENVERSIEFLRRFTNSEFITKSTSLGIERACISMPSLESPEKVYLSITEDIACDLDKCMKKKTASHHVQSKDAAVACRMLLQFATSKRATACFSLLLGKLQLEPHLLADYGILHDIVISIGRRRATNHQSVETSRSQCFVNGTDDAQFLNHVLEELSLEHRYLLVAKNADGRLPLHYAASYGLTDVYELLYKRMQDWNLATVLNLQDVEEMMLLKDGDGLTPLHLAVIGSHLATVETILDCHSYTDVRLASGGTLADQLLASDILDIALSLRHIKMCQVLIAHRIGLIFRGAYETTPLHTASCLGLTSCVELILKTGPSYGLHVDSCDTLSGWTPLIVACIEGHLEILELLLEAGADFKRGDFWGWSGLDHALLRGRLDIIQCPALKEADKTSNIGLLDDEDMYPRSGLSRLQRSSVKESRISQQTALHASQSCVVVNLGLMGPNTEAQAVKLNASLGACLDNPAGLAGLRLEIRTLDGAETYSYQLPILGGRVHEPCLFNTKAPERVGLCFKLYRATSGGRIKEVLVAGGIALLANLREYLGQHRESLVRYHTIPLLDTKSAEFAGTITFSFMIVKPFYHANIDKFPSNAAWKRPTSTLVVGHRGVGENVASQKSLQLGENTIPSFQAAISLGASGIETDVQLTKDLVPVLYHDFTVCETGLDAPMNTLSYDQFMHLNALQLPEDYIAIGETQERASRSNVPRRTKSRAYSQGSVHGSRANDLRARMGKTFEFQLRGLKGNTLESTIRQPFVTLKELLTDMPDRILEIIEISEHSFIQKFCVQR